MLHITRATLAALAAPVALLPLAGCPNHPSVVGCTDSTVCTLMAGGQCIAAPVGFDVCAYPSTECPSGLAWSPEAGDLAGQCVVADVDAGIDADAGTDAPTDAPSAQPGMVQVPAGPFGRGCNPAVDTCDTFNNLDEQPFTEITLDAFWIDQTEVTQAAFQTCIMAGTCTMPATAFDPVGRAQYPVGGVSWQQAFAYCQWAGKRLPTEAEWEKAARGADGRRYPWGSQAPTCQLAHYIGCPDGGDTSPLPVGSRPNGTSPYGAHDMAGNALEWVEDWFGRDYYRTAPTTNPQGPASGTYKVARGGAWAYGINYLRSSDRLEIMPTTAIAQNGFRCAKNP